VAPPGHAPYTLTMLPIRRACHRASLVLASWAVSNGASLGALHTASVVGVASLAVLTACAGDRDATRSPDVSVPDDVASEEELIETLEAVAMLPTGDPTLAVARPRAATWLAKRAEADVAKGELDSAVATLQTSVGLWRPVELKRPTPHPATAAAAEVVWRASAKRGDERDAAFALAVMRQFGDETQRRRAEDGWRELEQWVEDGRDLGGELGELSWWREDVASVLPVPWLVDGLVQQYRERIALLRARLDGNEADFNAYLLLRLLLTADRPEDAVRHMRELDLSPASREFAAGIPRALPNLKFGETTSDTAKGAPGADGADGNGKARGKSRGDSARVARSQPGGSRGKPDSKPQARGASAEALHELLDLFEPTAEDASRLPPFVVRQGWAIVENLARRGLELHDDDAVVHVELARALRQRGLRRAPMQHYRVALRLDEGLHDAWQDLAVLEQLELERIADRDPKAAAADLPRLEQFHGRAATLWADRPISPSVVDAYMTVAQALYRSGDPTSAARRLDAAIAIEPRPEALDLLATISERDGQFEAATGALRKLLSLAYDDQLERMFWEIQTRLRLGEVALRHGRIDDADLDLGKARSALDLLLSLPETRGPQRGMWLTLRARARFLSGDVDGARVDVHSAITAAPDDDQVYADPLVLAIVFGRLDDATEIVEHALVHSLRDGLDVYFSLWIADLAQRQSKPIPKAVQVRLERAAKGKDWTARLAAHSLGQIDDAALLASATDIGERAEAHFYSALAAFRRGDDAAGMAGLQKVIDSRMMSFFEYDMAQRYLEWRELPRIARSPR
jgi:tetratricopeptide (TPR) repeat protein